MTERHYLNPLFSWRGAIAASDLPATSKLVALTLSLYMNERGASAFPGKGLMARDTSLSTNAVRVHLKELVDLGWLVLVEHGGLRGEKRHANHYEARVPAAMGNPSDGASSVPGTGHPNDTDGASSVPPKRQESAIESAIGADAQAKRVDLLFEAIADACGYERATLTKSARGELNAARKAILEVGGDPDEVGRRAAKYRRKYRDAELTPSALAKHWPALGDARVAAAPVERLKSHAEYEAEERQLREDAAMDADQL